MVVSALLLVGTVYLFRIVPKGFIPSEDTGQLTARRRRAGYRLRGDGARISGRSRRSSRRPERCGASRRTSAALGGGNRAACSCDLKPRDERKLTADEVIEELRPKLARVPGVRVILSNPPPIRIGGQMSRSAHISSRCRIRTPKNCTRARRISRRRCATARAAGRHSATCRSAIRR